MTRRLKTIYNKRSHRVNRVETDHTRKSWTVQENHMGVTRVKWRNANTRKDQVSLKIEKQLELKYINKKIEIDSNESNTLSHRLVSLLSHVVKLTFQIFLTTLLVDTRSMEFLYLFVKPRTTGTYVQNTSTQCVFCFPRSILILLRYQNSRHRLVFVGSLKVQTTHTKGPSRYLVQI